MALSLVGYDKALQVCFQTAFTFYFVFHFLHSFWSHVLHYGLIVSMIIVKHLSLTYISNSLSQFHFFFIYLEKGFSIIICPLLRYINAMQSAMEYVFGSTFVCKTIDAAREVSSLSNMYLC